MLKHNCTFEYTKDESYFSNILSCDTSDVSLAEIPLMSISVFRSKAVCPIMTLPLASLPTLPTELVLVIADSLERQRDINALCRAHKTFYQLLNPRLYRHNARHAKGSALIYGACMGITKTVEMALDLGQVDVDSLYELDDPEIQTITSRQTPLFASLGGLGAKRAILQEYHGVGSGLRRSYWTALAFAVVYGHAEVVRLLLCPHHCAFAGVRNLNAPAVHLAAYLGRADMVQMLLDLGGGDTREALFVDSHGERGPGLCATPLYHGVTQLHCEVVELLLREMREPPYGPIATAEMTTSLVMESRYHRRGWSSYCGLVRALLGAEQTVFERMLHLLKSAGARLDEWELLVGATAEGLVDKARFFTENCMTGSHDLRPPLLVQPLHAAVENGQVELTEHLLSIGADPMMRALRAPHELGARASAYEGPTGIHAAMKGPDASLPVTIRLLIKHESDQDDTRKLVSCKTLPPRGLTPLMFLLAYGRHACPISSDRCPAARPFSSPSALATSAPSPAKIEDTDSSSSTMNTRIHPSKHCRCPVPGCAAVVKLLMSAGADVHARSLGGGVDNSHQGDDPGASPRSVLYFAVIRSCYWCRRAVLSALGYEAAVAMINVEQLPLNIHGGVRPRLNSWRRLLGRAWHDKFGQQAEEVGLQSKRKGRWKTNWKKWTRLAGASLVTEEETSSKGKDNLNGAERG